MLYAYISLIFCLYLFESVLFFFAFVVVFRSQNLIANAQKIWKIIVYIYEYVYLYTFINQIHIQSCNIPVSMYM